MLNENTYTITLSRLEICDLMLACTHVKWDAIDEMKNDPECPEYRRERVLPDTVKKWEGLHDKIKKQLNALDAGSVFVELAEKLKNLEIDGEEFKAELGRRAAFLL